jgi:cytochrome bd-type quinol oxidase subunit 1
MNDKSNLKKVDAQLANVLCVLLVIGAASGLADAVQMVQGWIA